MSILTIAWSMCAAASFMLGLMHLLFWSKDRGASVYLLSMLMAFSAGASAMIELALMYAESINAYRVLLHWSNLFVYTLLVPMVWYVKARLPKARFSLAMLITVLWTFALIMSWLSPFSLTFREITALTQMPTFWGEHLTLAVGSANPWVHMANLASVLIVLYVLDAAAHTWRDGDRRRAALVGGSVASFIVLGGIHAPLVDAGIVETPYMIGFAFLAIALALSYELVSNAVLAFRYAKEIRANEQRWRSLLTEVQLAVLGVDTRSRINYANPFLERLIGYPADELLEKPIAELVPVSDRQELTQRIAAAADRGPRAHSHWDFVCASGELRSFAWSTVRLNDRDGHYQGVLSIGEDITERLAAERKLASTRQELERLGRANLLGELVSALAHELNQPLAAILSNAQAARRYLASGNAEPTELQEILDDIVRDDKRAGEVVHGLRQMLEKVEIERESFQIQGTIREVLGLIGGELDAKGISVRLELNPDLPSVHACRVEIQQVIMNLLLNAVHALSDASPERRRISIRAKCHGEEAVEVAIEDQGPGITPDGLSRIFEPLFTTRTGGLGMGLAICRRILESH